MFQATPGNTEVSGVALTGNAWAYSGAPFAVNETLAAWTKVHDLEIVGVATWAGAPLQTTKATQLAPLSTAAVNTTLDFAAQLLFPSVPIDPASVTLQLHAGNAAAPPSSASVVVQGQQVVVVYAGNPGNVQAIARVSVDQGTYSTTKVAGGL